MAPRGVSGTLMNEFEQASRVYRRDTTPEGYMPGRDNASLPAPVSAKHPLAPVHLLLLCPVLFHLQKALGSGLLAHQMALCLCTFGHTTLNVPHVWTHSDGIWRCLTGFGGIWRCLSVLPN